MLGIDIVKVDRIGKLNSRDNFIKKIFSNDEKKYLEKKNYSNETIAGMFACKEAVLKVLGVGIGSINFSEIEILHEESGKPYVRLSEKAKKILRNKSLSENLEISISHEREFRIGVCIGKYKIENIEDELTFQYDLAMSILKRDKAAHKGNYGKVGIIGGKKGMTGSVFLSSLAALRTGSGLVYLLVPESISEILEMKCVEQIILPIEDQGKGFFIKESLVPLLKEIKTLDAIAIGPGMGTYKDNVYILKELLSKVDIPIVVDADGLNRIAKDLSILKNRKSKIIITPHEQEFARLCNTTARDIRNNRLKYSQDFAKKYNIIVLLKGHETIVTDGELIYINNTGNPSMATAGSGDVLTGSILSFLGQGYNPLLAARLGAYIHGLSGDISKNILGENGVIASDIAFNITRAMKYLEEKKNEL